MSDPAPQAELHHVASEVLADVCERLAGALLGRARATVSTRRQGGTRTWRAYVPGHEDLVASGVSELEALRRLRVRLRAAAQAEARRLERSASEREQLAADERARAERLLALAKGGPTS